MQYDQHLIVDEEEESKGDYRIERMATQVKAEDVAAATVAASEFSFSELQLTKSDV